MRLLINTVLTGIIAATGAYGLFQAGAFVQACSQPLSYQVGEIDAEFRLATSTLKTLLADAEKAWESDTGRDLFVHDPDGGELVINMEYDQRQRRTKRQNELSSELSSLVDSHEGLTESLADKQSRYEDLLANYESARKQYENALTEFNSRVEKWERKSAVPADVKGELESQRDQLNQARSSLSDTREELVQLRDEINSLADRSNYIAEEYNQKAETFASRFGSSREFSQATYKDDTITVYQFNGRQDLRLALAHEFGHALGIRHVDNPEAVMYHLMEKQTLQPISLTEADRAAVRNVCGT